MRRIHGSSPVRSQQWFRSARTQPPDRCRTSRMAPRSCTPRACAQRWRRRGRLRRVAEKNREIFHVRRRRRDLVANALELCTISPGDGPAQVSRSGLAGQPLRDESARVPRGPPENDLEVACGGHRARLDGSEVGVTARALRSVSDGRGRSASPWPCEGARPLDAAHSRCVSIAVLDEPARAALPPVDDDPRCAPARW